jgi:hypothetical protein
LVALYWWDLIVQQQLRDCELSDSLQVRGRAAGIPELEMHFGMKFGGLGWWCNADVQIRNGILSRLRVRGRALIRVDKPWPWYWIRKLNMMEIMGTSYRLLQCCTEKEKISPKLLGVQLRLSDSYNMVALFGWFPSR